MRYVAAILILFSAWQVTATTWTAATSSPADINAVINSNSTVAGDTVLVHGSGAVTWNSPVTLNKSITLQGDGMASTIINNGLANGSCLVIVGPSSPPWMTITGFRFNGNAVPAVSTVGMIHASGGQYWRFCTNYMEIGGTGISQFSKGALIDHNYVRGDANNPTGVYINGDNTAWNTTVHFGNPLNWTYVEANTFDWDPALQLGNGAIDGCFGGSVCFRYNTCTNSTAGTHGPDTTGQNASSFFAMESYSNYMTFDLGPHNADAAQGLRGGTGLFWGNTIANPNQPMNQYLKLQYYRYSQPNQLGGWPAFPASIDGWLPGFIAGYPGLMQPGYTGPIGGVNVQTGLNTGGSTNCTEVSFPVRIWTNYFTGRLNNWVAADNIVRSNIDWIMDVPLTNYVPLPFPYPLNTPSNPPSIFTQPVTTSVITNQSATFSVAASGSGTLTYQWNWTGTNVPSATNSSWTTPPALLAWNNSQVYVNVTNLYGSVFSSTVFLQVTNPVLRTFYVATNGSDSTGTGSLALPWATVGHATGLMNGGDTLNIRGGTYSQIFDILGPSGTSTTPTIVQAYNGETPIFNENNITSGAHSIDHLSWLVLSGVTIMSNNIGMAVGVLGAVTNVTLTNCTIAYIGQQGLQIEKNSHHVTVVNCTIHDTGLWINNGEGMYVGQGDSAGVTDNTHDILVKGCTIYNTTDEGIELKGGTYNVTVQGCTLYTNNLPQNPYGAGGGAIEVDEEGNNNFWPANPNQVISGNVVHNTVIGIRGGTGGTYFNNIVYNCSSSGMLINNNTGQAANPTYPRLFYNNTVDNSPAIVLSTGASDIQNNIGYSAAFNLPNSSAYFVNSAGHDYHLTGSGAPIGAGKNLINYVATDFDGNARPSAGAFDIGAYQYVRGTNGVPLPPTGLHVVPSL